MKVDKELMNSPAYKRGVLDGRLAAIQEKINLIESEIQIAEARLRTERAQLMALKMECELDRTHNQIKEEMIATLERLRGKDLKDK